jgi:hypothetical protein
MYPAKPLIYEDIFEAFKQGVIAKLGNPQLEADWNTRHTAANPFRLRPLLQLGSRNDSDGNGAVVTVPEGYTTLWLRLHANGSGLKAYFLDGAGEALGHWWVGGRPYQVCPDGSLPDNVGAPHYDHQWLAIPVSRAGKVALISQQSEGYVWYSGVAFSRNPWAHAAQSARGYALGFNGSKGVTWFGWQSERFAGDQAGSITRNLSQGGQALQVPVLPNGRDKLLYLVNAPEVVYGVGSSSSTGVYQDVYSPYDNGLQLTGIRVNGQPVERFLATYDNPFARYWNSRPGCNYNAALVPAELIPANARFLQVEIDLSKQEDDIKFREVGTHDLDVPLTD